MAEQLTRGVIARLLMIDGDAREQANPADCDSAFDRIDTGASPQIKETFRMALHFVGFRDDRYWKPDEHYIRAVAIFGRPDFCHIGWDERAFADVAPGDTVIWANYGGGEADCLPPFLKHTFDDSRQDIIANGGEKGVDYL